MPRNDEFRKDEYAGSDRRQRTSRSDRRQFFAAAAAAGFGAYALAAVPLAASEEDEGDDVSAAEDLMREHGVLNRILLLFEEGLRRLRNDGQEGVTPELFHAPAALVRT